MVTNNSINTIFTPTGSNRALIQPKQPCFLAFLSANVLLVTGDGTTYDIIPDTVSFDLGSNYNNGTGKFTAPATGLYLFQGGVSISGMLVANNSFFLTLRSSNSAATCRIATVNPFAYNPSGGGGADISGCGIIPLTSGDTMNLEITGSNGTKVINVLGSASVLGTWISGHLIC